MPSKIQVDQIAGATGSTVTLPSGQTLDLSSGTVTLPNSAVNLTTKVTGTLPVANGGTGITALGTAGQALKVNSGATGLEFGTVASGKILQVVYGQHTTYSSTTSTSYQDLSASTNVTITPSAISSKILVIAHFNEVYANGTHSGGLQVTENGTMVAKLGQCLFIPNYNGEKMDNYNFIFVRSPSSTSAIQYKMQFRSTSGGLISVCQDNNPASSLTLMEIGV